MLGPSVSRIVCQLVEEGLVREAKSPNRRIKILELTISGAARLERCEHAAAELFTQISDMQGMGKFQELVQQLNGLANNCEGLS